MAGSVELWTLCGLLAGVLKQTVTNMNRIVSLFFVNYLVFSHSPNVFHSSIVGPCPHWLQRVLYRTFLHYLQACLCQMTTNVGITEWLNDLHLVVSPLHFRPKIAIFITWDSIDSRSSSLTAYPILNLKLDTDFHAFTIFPWSFALAKACILLGHVLVVERRGKLSD